MLAVGGVHMIHLYHILNFCMAEVKQGVSCLSWPCVLYSCSSAGFLLPMNGIPESLLMLNKKFPQVGCLFT